ncbi:hypothetical protein QBC35DRAFT_209239 [Podospora australis]|uniref:Uncharacterized protein n=1 Tax=Podospora australis TaxID=1536484 RepID=A0AAN7AJD8_9PEZI|nr:hypothetical protein QBC35DRAFT_209239 [Podospora australis]
MTNNAKNEKPLRQLAAEKLHGKGANPSMLGDPISLKAEANDKNNPAPSGDKGNDDGLPDRVKELLAEGPPSNAGTGSHEEKMLRGEGHHVSGMMTGEIRQGKTGPPSKSLEGDATVLGKERVVGDASGGKGNGRGSKL